MALPPVFDLVSIHPVGEDDKTPTHISNPVRRGYIKAVNVNVKALMEVAYDIPDTRMLGGPNWLTSEKFSLEAKADPKVDEQLASLPPEQGKQLKRKMLAALLADRFKLAMHTETREMPVYAMVVAKGGAKLDVTKSADAPPLTGSDLIDIRTGNNSLRSWPTSSLGAWGGLF